MKSNVLPRVVILGTNEIASAVAVHLRRAGWDVILCYDSFPPVVRRGMAFHDVLFGDDRTIEGIGGVRAETAHDIAAALADPEHVAVTALSHGEVLALHSADVLLDARMQKHNVTPDLRGVACVAVGLGPLFRVGMNCDIAVETKPARNGHVVKAGSTHKADGISSRLGGVGPERFVYSDRPGQWHTAVDIGVEVSSRFALGHLDGRPMHAPLDGVVRGIVRDGLRVPNGVKLIEIDPRGRNAKWTGIDDRGRCIAEAAVKAIQIKLRQLATPRKFDASSALRGKEQRSAV
jgi:hypothetical protein